MPKRSEDQRKDAGQSTRRERVIKATSVARGVAVGTIQILHGLDRQFFKREIEQSAIENEVERFRQALAMSRRQLERAMVNGSSEPVKEILSVQRMMLDDATLQRDVESTITSSRLNAEWATVSVIANFSARLRSLSDEGLRDRHIDVEDVGERLLAALVGSTPHIQPVSADTVIAASELRPSTLATLADSGIRGIVTEHGGWTSHTFILARELGIPAVTGVRDLVRRVCGGDEAIVDGNKGKLVLNPTLESRRRFDVAVRPVVRKPRPATRELQTRDGREIRIRANIDITSYYSEARRLGARGIGLFRSEFLFNRFNGMPNEAQQFEAYRELAAMAGADGAVIRTFDVGLRQLIEDVHYRERNPALGLRAIRLSLSRPSEFRVQLRALMRAAADSSLKISLPMISGVGEIKDARRMLVEEHKILEAENVDHEMPPIGAMVEVPSAIFIIDKIVEESDFICLGTNDLVQYILAVDRDNELVAGWFNTLHPSILRAVKKVVDECSKAGKELIVCGEMAGSAYYAPVLVGLGATVLSMNVNAIGRIREVIGAINFEVAQKLADEALRSNTSEEADAVLHEHVQKYWPELYPSQNDR